MTIRSREVHLASRPEGRPTTDNFKIVDVELPDPGPEQVLVRNSFMSVDPYMRPRMDDVDSYVPAFEIDAPLDGAAVGEVIASTSSSVVLGELVSHALGWREYALLPERRIQRLARSRASPTVHLGVLGMPGLTAYVGLHDIAQLTDGDIVFVSAAAGAVGSLVCQLAKARGHTVIGSAGSSEKVSYLLDELGLDAAFDITMGRSRSSWPSQHLMGSTFISTMSAAITWKLLSRWQMTMPALPCVAPSPATTMRCHQPAHVLFVVGRWQAHENAGVHRERSLPSPPRFPRGGHASRRKRDHQLPGDHRSRRAGGCSGCPDRSPRRRKNRQDAGGPLMSEFWETGEPVAGVVVARCDDPPMSYFTAAAAGELRSLLRGWRDDRVRVVIITGAGGRFITHYDVAEIAGIARDPARARALGVMLAEGFRTSCRRSRTLTSL
jgi:hypothetical protein